MSLAERSLKKAEPILEKYRNELYETGNISRGALKKELLQSGAFTGFEGSAKLFFIQAAKATRYRYLVAYYMEHSAQGRVNSEFKSSLAKLYGIDDYHSPEKGRMRKAFWAELKALRDRGNGHKSKPA